MPGGSIAQHRFHPLADALDRIFEVSSFVIVFGAPCDVAMEWKSEIGRSVMSANRLVVSMRDGHFLEHVLVATRYARVIHHLAQTNDAIPCHRLSNFFGTDARAGSLEAGS